MSFSSFNLFDSGTNILVFGKDGQVGRALQNCFADLRISAVFLGRAECDLSNETSIREALNRYQPHIIINASAYTAVDQAESEKDQAFAINAIAPKVMANYIANTAKGVLVHFSTDYVYAGDKKTPYVENDPTSPLGQYGKTKLAGEQAIAEEFKKAKEADAGIHSPGMTSHATKFSRYFILRTSWVYGEGNNFIRTMLRLAQERELLKVIADQHGVPTSADWLAQLAIQFAGSRNDSGIYHAVPDGDTSWHGLAVFAIETARMAGEGIKVQLENIIPIPATEYPLPAPRPSNSRMENAKLKEALSEMAFTGEFPKWQSQVEQYVKQYVKESLKS